MKFPDFKGSIGKIMSEHASTLLTAGGVVGVVGTAVLTGKAAWKAAQIVDDAMREKVDEADETITTMDKVKLTWPYFVPPVACGSLTIASIVMANRVSAKEAAALAAAYGISQNQLEEYKAKVLEKVGVKKEKAIRDEIAQDQVNANPPGERVLVLNEGLVLCYDSLSGRYWHCTADKIGKAENAVNGELFHHQICSLSFFYDQVGLKPTELSDGLGWNMSTSDDRQLRVELSSTLTDDERTPCLNIGFNMLPKHGYEQLY